MRVRVPSVTQPAAGTSVAKDRFMLNPAALDSGKAEQVGADFWLRLFNDAGLAEYDDLEKIVIGCEIIAALDAVDLLAA